jgi:hypothetical protein
MEGFPRPVQGRWKEIWVRQVHVHGHAPSSTSSDGFFCVCHPHLGALFPVVLLFPIGRREIQAKIERLVLIIEVLVAKFLDMSSVEKEEHDNGKCQGDARSFFY